MEGEDINTALIYLTTNVFSDYNQNILNVVTRTVPAINDKDTRLCVFGGALCIKEVCVSLFSLCEVTLHNLVGCLVVDVGRSETVTVLCCQSFSATKGTKHAFQFFFLNADCT